jgi:hypothetical protein
MPVVLVHEGITREQYEDVVRRLTGGKGRLESPSDWPVAGLIVHAAGQGEKGFRVVDVWESMDAVEQFGAVLTPLLKEAGVQAQPEIYDPHTYVSR